MPRPTAPAHYLRPNRATRVPRHFVYLDTEAHTARGRAGEEQTFALGVTVHESWPRAGRRAPPPESACHLDPAALWAWVAARSHDSNRLVVVAHNMAYDLRVSGALVELPAQGWATELLAVDARSAYWRIRRGARAMVFVDLWSWVPQPLWKIGEMVGLPKLPMPPAGAPDEAWVAYCARDVEIVREAWRRIMGRIERDDWGTWQPTGAAMAMSLLRHRFPPHKVLVGLDAEITAPEREAGHAGRCEAWRWGPVQAPAVAEWDYELAYGHLARDLALPARPILRRAVRPTEATLRMASRACVCALVEVTTELPVVPARHEGHVVWPVGTFRTWLWDPELRLLESENIPYSIELMRLWRPGPVLRDAMRYVLRLATDAGEGADPVIRAVARQWTRTLVGRFGMRYRRWEPYGRSDVPDLRLSHLVDTTSGTRSRLLQAGHELLLEGPMTDAPSSQPAIMAYVMSACRVALWGAMRAAGLEEVLYVDTDSLLVGPTGDRRLRAAVDRGELPGLRRKRSWKAVTIYGPRQLRCDAELRAAGVPKRARRVGPDTYRAEFWRRLSASLARGEPDRVVIRTRDVTLRHTDRRRAHLEGGATAPHRVTATEVATAPRMDGDARYLAALNRTRGRR